VVKIKFWCSLRWAGEKHGRGRRVCLAERDVSRPQVETVVQALALIGSHPVSTTFTPHIFTFIVIVTIMQSLSSHDFKDGVSRVFM
jgi:hypothetical protein